MIKRNHIGIKIALISMLLLMGQLGVFTHSIEHLSHAQEQSCQIFLQCEKLGNALISHTVKTVPLPNTSLLTARFTRAFSSLTITPYLSRAPPSLT
jgi:hypothetical protein